MPQQVEESSISVRFWNMVISTLVCLVPVIILAFVSIGFKGVWGTPYARFVLYFLISNSFFALTVGLGGSVNKIAWLVLQCLGAAATVAVIVWSYVSMDALMLHFATATFFLCMIYITCSAGDNIYVCNLIPAVPLLAGLFTVLWFIGVGMSLTAHIVIVSVLNGIFLLISVIYLVKFFRTGGLARATARTIRHEEATKEEIRAKKAAKARKKADKIRQKAAKARSKQLRADEKAEAKRLHDEDPDVIAKRERAEERKEKAKKAAGTVGKAVGSVFSFTKDAVRSMLGGPPMGSENWDIDRWSEYITEGLESTLTGIALKSVYPSVSIRHISFRVILDADGCSAEETRTYSRYLKDKYRKLTKHCPYGTSFSLSVR